RVESRESFSVDPIGNVRQARSPRLLDSDSTNRTSTPPTCHCDQPPVGPGLPVTALVAATAPTAQRAHQTRKVVPAVPGFWETLVALELENQFFFQPTQSYGPQSVFTPTIFASSSVQRSRRNVGPLGAYLRYVSIPWTLVR